jgi:hypothetical protein
MVAYVTYRRPQRRTPLALLGLASVALLSMAACSKLGLGGGGGEDQMSWARAALERNNRLEVVAADPETSTFTVRVKDTGELKMIRVDQVVGDPPGMSPPASSPSGTAAPANSQPAPESSDLNTPTATASTNSAAQQSNASSPDGTAPGSPGAASGPAPSTAMSRARTSSNVPRTGLQSEPAPEAEAPNPNSDVASVTPGGRTLESGPGYAIKVASKTAAPTARAERERSGKTSAAVERRHEPIICQGERLLQIDNRNLEFDGDAVSAQDGCEIHITNSHITAKGVGISARAANVHIDNSQIEGDSASIDASDGAQVYASSSKFKGMSRRLDKSSFHDLGGNVWN